VNRWRVRLSEFQGEAVHSSSRVQNVQNVQKSLSIPTFEHFGQFEQLSEPAAPNDAWTDIEEERAAMAEHDGGAPRRWAEGFAGLNPARPPADVPTSRWVQFIEDCGRFLDDGWAIRAEVLGWGPLDLFGCDRERPLARPDHAGLLWLVKGGKLVELTPNMATLETLTGCRQTYRRRPVEVGRVVLAWELVALNPDTEDPPTPDRSRLIRCGRPAGRPV
jgi:hypothetical protein